MRISDWSSDVCSSDLVLAHGLDQVPADHPRVEGGERHRQHDPGQDEPTRKHCLEHRLPDRDARRRSPSELEPEDVEEQVRERSEERREGKECVSTSKSRWWTDHKKKKEKKTQ